MKFLKIAWFGAFSVVALTYPLAWVIAGAATEAVLITKYDESKILINREMDAPSAGDPAFAKKVIGMYGIEHETTRVLFVPEERFFHPQEMPTLRLLPVDKQKGENPLQVQTVHFFARWIVIGSGAAAVLLLAAWWVLARRSSGGKPA